MPDVSSPLPLIRTKLRRPPIACDHVHWHQFIKIPANSILNYGKSITLREVVQNLGKNADGIVDEMPTAMPGLEAPNAESQTWLDKFIRLYK